MEIRTVEECFKYRLLRKIKPDLEKAGKSMEIAKVRLQGAKDILKIGEGLLYQHVIVDSYTAMFHGARALLYKEGIQEKSHFAVYIYLKEIYDKAIPINIINLLNIYRIERHELLYGLDYKRDEEEAKQAIIDAQTFIIEIEKIINKEAK